MYRSWKHMNRKFGYSKIKWKIDDYNVLLVCESWKIFSPQFYVRGEWFTKWQMVLEKKFVSTNILLSLKLLNSNGSNFMGKCEICVSDETELLEKEFEFGRNFYSKTIEFDSRNLRGNDVLDSTLTVDLELFVSFMGCEEDVAPCKNESVQLLSNALYNLYECRYNKDVLLSVGEENPCFLPAHKAILYSRNGKLKKMISSKERSDYFCFDRFSREDACIKILRFLYSACMRHVLDVPMKSVFELASAYDISPITTYYAPDELTLYTEVVTERFDATWLIHEDCLENTEIISFMDMTWILKFYPVRLENDNYVAVVVEFVEGKVKAALVEISFKSNRSDNHSKMSKNLNDFRKVYPARNEQFLMDGKFIHTDLLKKYVHNGALIVGFRIRWISSNNFFSLPQTRLSVGTNIVMCRPYCEQANYMRLSEDMAKLYASGKFRNLGFDLNSRRFIVNSAIFSARCFDLYRETERNNLAELPFYRTETLEKLIRFIYCCDNAESFNPGELISLAVFANVYHLDTLKYLLLHIFEVLQRHVDESLKRQFQKSMNRLLRF